MAVGVTIEVKMDEAKRVFARIGRTMEPRKILKAVALQQVGWIDRNFRAGGIEGRWPKLAPNTVLGRRKGSNVPLQDTGRLKQSFGRGRQPIRLTSTSVTVGTNLDYAESHEEGTRPHIIRPLRKRALAFPTVGGPRVLKNVEKAHQKGSTGVITSRGVRHPGIPRRRILPTKALAERMAVGLIEARVRREPGVT